MEESSAEETRAGNKKKTLGSHQGIKQVRSVSCFGNSQGTASSKMLSIVAGKTIETLIKQLVPNDRSHYLKSTWIENGKYSTTLNKANEKHD